ncbi:unnamed protein product [Clonostachys rosea f. rosea IK726]|uniref:Uncharacterized protein n=1 Tax=Clonostachys rosea f. rosea IK726 TaxID=1349383 RepID=A0ACA9UR59_BIOOC|nr:unnamed protein product [Clonostachys rosea f. rosea IK726]
MDHSNLWERTTEYGPGPGPYPNVLEIPTPPLQAAGVFIMFVLPGIAVIIFALRVYTRVTMRTLGVDDYLCGMALVSAILVSSTLFMFFKLNYYGWEDEKVPEYDPSAGLWWNFFEQLCYNPVLALVKFIWGLMIFTILHAIAVFFGALFQCIPIATNWHPELKKDPNTRCIDNSFHIIQSSITIATDVAILVLPFWIFLGLRMAKGAKIAVLGVFLVVYQSLPSFESSTSTDYSILREKSRHYNIAYVWTAVEVNLAVISCSMPALRPLFSRWYPKLFGTDSGGKSNSTPYDNSLGQTSRVTAQNRSNVRDSHYALKDLHPASRKHNQHTEIRGISPSGSEEEIMTYNGILRTTNVAVQYEDTKKSDNDSHVSSDIAGVTAGNDKKHSEREF